MTRLTVVTILTLVLLVISFLAGQASARFDYARTLEQRMSARSECGAVGILLLVLVAIWVIAFFGWPS